MLVLSRNVGESLVLTLPDGEVTVCVVDIDRGKVRLSFDAPLDVQIMRSELLEREEEQ